MEEPTEQQWMWLKEVQFMDSLCRSSLSLELQPVGSSPWWGGRTEVAAAVKSSAQRMGPVEPCWGSARRAAACGKPTQNQFGKDNIPREGILWNMGRE